MENITSEVSKKVKSAIKAKLTELGAYVDDELPDYIMILVGNKKTKDQMDDDLSLFLGHNTERFTSWLHAVLEKLNAASKLHATKISKEKGEDEKRVEQEPENADLAPDKKKHKKKKDKNERKKERKEKKKKKDKDREKDKSEKSLLKAQRKKEKEAKLLAAGNSTCSVISKIEEATNANDSSEKIVSDDKSNICKSTVVKEKENLNTDIRSVHVVKKKDVNSEEDDQLAQDVVDLRPNAADLTLDLEEEAPIKKRKSDANNPQLSSNASSKPSTIIIHVKNDAISELASESLSPTRTVSESRTSSSSPKTSIHDRLGPATSTSSKRIINLREESTFPPKSFNEDGAMNRVLSSAITSAVKSSMVLKSSSDGKPSKKLEARVRPLVSSRIVKTEDIDEEIAVPPARLVSTVVAVQKRPHSSDESDDENEPATKKLTGIASKIEVTPRPKRSTAGQANTALIMRAMADAHKSVNKPMKRILEDKEEQSPKKELFTRSYQERKNQRLGTGVEGKKVQQYAITVPNALLNDKLKSGIHRDDTNGDGVKLEENYMRELEPHEKNDMEGLVEEGPEKPPHMRNQAVKRKLPLPGDENLGSTRFIVTLDGFGNDSGDLRARLNNCRPPVRAPSVEEEEEYIEEVEEWEEEVEEIEAPNLENVAKVAPAGAVTYGAKLKLVKDPVTQVAKKDERCRFWPACKEGDTCKFVHPTKSCLTFPKCRFGDKCVFIHPKCKFDAACTKMDCPFTHTVARHLANPVPGIPAKVKFPTSHVSKIKCHFYPKCVDMNCPFMHPKQVCRYGKACQMIGCPYIHPDVTTGSLLKWTAPKVATTTSVTKTASDSGGLSTASLTKKLHVLSEISPKPVPDLTSTTARKASLNFGSQAENPNTLEANKPMAVLSSS